MKRNLMTATAMALLLAANMNVTMAGPNKVPSVRIAKPKLLNLQVLRPIHRKKDSETRSSTAVHTDLPDKPRLPANSVALPKARPLFAGNIDAIRDASEMRDLAELGDIAQDVDRIDPMTDFFGQPGGDGGDAPGGADSRIGGSGFDPMARLAGLNDRLDDGSGDTPTGKFSDSVTGTTESLAAGARDGLASLKELSRTNTPMPGGRHVRVESLLGDGSFMVEEHTYTTEGTRSKWWLYSDNGPLGYYLDGGESWSPADEPDATYEVIEPVYFEKGSGKPGKGIDKMQTPETAAGGGLLAPNCGSANCNEIRRMLNGGGAYIYGKLARGGRAGPSRDGADHGVPATTRFVSEFDLVGQPHPDAAQGDNPGRVRPFEPERPGSDDPRGER